jgi:uncharacterized protein
MGELIRLLLLALLVWLGWRWLTQRQHPAPPDTAPSSQPPAPMVRCAHCALHLPAADAFHYRDLHFCCQQHQADFLQAHQGERN